MEKEREEKQNYLREQIIEKNFCPDVFMEYCEGIKGADIDVYTFEELQKIVQDFVKAQLTTAEISVPETQVEPPIEAMRSSISDLRHELKFVKKSDSSAYSITAVKMHDNTLSLEDVITVKIGE